MQRIERTKERLLFYQRHHLCSISTQLFSIRKYHSLINTAQRPNTNPNNSSMTPTSHLFMLHIHRTTLSRPRTISIHFPLLFYRFLVGHAQWPSTARPSAVPAAMWPAPPGCSHCHPTWHRSYRRLRSDTASPPR